MKLINVDELIMQLPDDLPYKSSVSKRKNFIFLNALIVEI